ncbi:mCG1051115 [Mus musculus]|nr:mCG1051115 [Mus musculus]
MPPHFYLIYRLHRWAGIQAYKGTEYRPAWSLVAPSHCGSKSGCCVMIWYLCSHFLLTEHGYTAHHIANLL